MWVPLAIVLHPGFLLHVRYASLKQFHIAFSKSALSFARPSIVILINALWPIVMLITYAYYSCCLMMVESLKKIHWGFVTCLQKEVNLLTLMSCQNSSPSLSIRDLKVHAYIRYFLVLWWQAAFPICDKLSHGSEEGKRYRTFYMQTGGKFRLNKHMFSIFVFISK